MDYVAPGVTAAELAELNPHAVEARYPGEIESLGRAEAEGALEIARKIRRAARIRLDL